MCMMCKGASLDEVLFFIHGAIERVGWAVIPVTGKRPSTSWAYTVGLAALGHPELVTVGRAPQTAGRLLNSLGRRVAEGETFGPDSPPVVIGGKRYVFAPVSKKYFENGTFGAWVGYYGALGPPRPKPRAVEVVSTEEEPRLRRLGLD